MSGKSNDKMERVRLWESLPTLERRDPSRWRTDQEGNTISYHSFHASFHTGRFCYLKNDDRQMDLFEVAAYGNVSVNSKEFAPSSAETKSPS